MNKKQIVLDDIYVLGGGIGCWAKSFERKVRKGDVRVIGGILMEAHYVYERGFLGLGKKEICWSPVDDNINNYRNMSLFVSCSNHDYPMIGFMTNDQLNEKGGPEKHEGY